MLPRLLLVVAVLVALPACEWVLPGEAPRFSEEVPLGEPWSGMGLPVGQGKVTVSAPETVSVHYAGTAPPVLAGAYAEALEADGWTLDVDRSSAEIVSQTWAKEGRTLSLAVLERDGVTVVSLADVPF